MNDLSKSVSEIVAAYVSHNALPHAELPHLIASVHGILGQITKGKTVEASPEAEITPAVPIKKSIRPNALTCLVCGKSFVSLRRHLSTDHDLTADTYKARFALPKDYPMVAPEYSARRSALAKESGLGNRRSGKRKEANTESVAEPKKGRGRPRKVLESVAEAA